MYILGIETSGKLCSVAFQKEKKLLLEYNHRFPNNHSAILADLVIQGLRQLKLKPENIDIVAVASGPGSFTGLRIGMSYVKGFCYALKKTMISVSNFEVLASQVRYNIFPIYTLIDAHRGNVYEAVFRSDTLNPDEMFIKKCSDLPGNFPVEGSIISDNPHLLKDLNLKNKSKVLKGQFAAKYICETGYRKYLNGIKEDIDIVEPLYIQKFAGVA